MTEKIRLHDALLDLGGALLLAMIVHKADRESNPNHVKECDSCRMAAKARKGAKP